MSIIFKKLFLDGNQLQNIVDLINNENNVLVFNKNRIEILKETVDTQYYFCPGNMCKHSKMNVLKLVEKFENMDFQKTVCINACKENCIRKNADLSITCTVGGIHAENTNLNSEELDKIMKKFDDERNVKKRK